MQGCSGSCSRGLLVNPSASPLMGFIDDVLKWIRGAIMSSFSSGDKFMMLLCQSFVVLFNDSLKGFLFLAGISL